MSPNYEECKELDEFIPKHIKKIGFRSFAILTAIIFLYDFIYLFKINDVPPNDLSMSSILLISIAGTLFFGIPWHKLGIDLKKFGPLEFERKLEGQSQEHVQAIVDLENRINEMEESILKQNSSEKKMTDEKTSNRENDEKRMQTLLIDFLGEYHKWNFSPARIESYSADKDKYKDLSKNGSLLRSVLRKLVAQGILSTRISEKGNTLYRIKD